MPNCSSDCNRIYGPSVACDICNAIDVATIISNFSVSVLECGVRTFSFLGYSLCLVSYILLCVKFHFVHSNLVKEFIMHSKVERTDIQTLYSNFLYNCKRADSIALLTFSEYRKPFTFPFFSHKPLFRLTKSGLKR